MKKFEVEFAKFVVVEIEANNEDEANEKAAMMEDEDIESYHGYKNFDGYQIWNTATQKE